MDVMTTASPDPLALQATLVDFALAELVRQNRESFQPLWSSE
ncbi:MAG: protein phosphatase, partial [Vulcanococcus sp.]